MAPRIVHTITPLVDGGFRHELTFALGHDARLELVTPEGEIRKVWTTAETGLTQWDGTHLDEREDLTWRMAEGELFAHDDIVT